MQSTSIVPKPCDYVEAIYSSKPYVGQFEEIDGEGEEVHINFFEHKGDLQRRSKFHKPIKEDKIWIPLSDTIYIVTEPTATKFEFVPIYTYCYARYLERFNFYGF